MWRNVGTHLEHHHIPPNPLHRILQLLNTTVKHFVSQFNQDLIIGNSGIQKLDEAITKHKNYKQYFHIPVEFWKKLKKARKIANKYVVRFKQY